MAEYNPSVYEISKCVLTSYDGATSRDLTSNFVGSFQITQSMFQTTYNGSITIMDGADVLDGMPIRGEETLELEIITFDESQYKLNIVGQIHKVSDIRPAQGSDSLMYTLHFVSRASFNASTYASISEAYKTSMSFGAEQIFDKYFGRVGDRSNFIPGTNRLRPFQTYERPLIADQGRSIVIQPSVGLSNIIIPDISAPEAMYMFASRAYNPDTPSLSYRFFETIEKYYFCTDEFFLTGVEEADVVDLFYAPVVDYDRGGEGQSQRIESIQIMSKGVDTSTDIYSGSYRSRVTEIDLVRGAVNHTDFNYDDTRYIDMSGTPRDMNFNPHTEQFRRDIFREDNAKTFTVFRDYLRNGDTGSTLSNDRNLAPIIQNRISYYHHLNNTSLAASMMGRLDLRPGQIVNLDLLSLSGLDQGQGLHKTMSGRYLLQAVTHESNGEGSVSTQLKMAKFDWSAPGGQQIPSTSPAA